MSNGKAAKDYTRDFEVVLGHELQEVTKRRAAVLTTPKETPKKPSDASTTAQPATSEGTNPECVPTLNRKTLGIAETTVESQQENATPACEEASINAIDDSPTVAVTQDNPIVETVADPTATAQVPNTKSEKAATAQEVPLSTPSTEEELTARVFREAMKMNLIGLSLCGGGIRSATFSLGLLQALGSLDLIKRLDYISSVSGGGYIHAWLAAWIRRETSKKNETGNEATLTPLENVSTQLAPSRVTQAQATRDGVPLHGVRNEEPAPVHHLREYSRYLAPRSGLLGLDSTAIIGLYFRNLLANGIIFVAAGICLSLICRLMVLAFAEERIDPNLILDPFAAMLFLGSVIAWRCNNNIGILLIIMLYVFQFYQIYELSQDRNQLDLIQQIRSYFILFFSFIFLLFAQFTYRWSLVGVRLRERSASTSSQDTAVSTVSEHSNVIFWRVILPCLASVLIAMWLIGPSSSTPSRLPEGVRFGKGEAVNTLKNYLSYITIFGIIGLGTGFLLLFIQFIRSLKTHYSLCTRDFWYQTLCNLIGSAAFGAAFGAILCAVLDNLGHIVMPEYATAPESMLYVAYGPAVMMAAFSVCGYLEAILVGRYISEVEREWRARVGAMFLVVAACWAAVFSVVFFLPWLVRLVWVWNGGWAVIGGWVVSGVASYVLRPSAGEKPTKSRGSLVRSWALVVAPLMFLAGLVALASVLAHNLYGVAGKEGDFLHQSRSGKLVNVSGWLLVFAVFGTIYACLVDPNRFSLHSLYGNRLVRCYLAASRKKRGWQPAEVDYDPSIPSPGVPTYVADMERVGEPFTGFGHRDDFSLSWLQPDTNAFPKAPENAKFEEEPWKRPVTPYYGPYPLFNTTMNLVGGKDLATQDRKGESFVLSPGYCGSKLTGWARLRATELANASNLTLGRAMTISGAAVDPNMQNYQSTGLTALLTLLNARLGWWIQNPWMTRPKNHGGTGRPWIAETPWSAWYLIQEAMGNTRADTDFVHLSDGGHFENTGAYELIRRRCRFVILCDAAEDPMDASENLANLIRLVRTDFGIRIEIDTSPLRKDADGMSAAHVAVGMIRYDDVDHGAINGTLVFIRSSLTGDEPADLKNYAATNPPFPHHGTANQFFDEPMFESYRLLGHHIGMQVFGPAADELRQDRVEDDHKNYGRKLFSELRRRWALLPVDLLKNYHDSVDSWLHLEKAMQSDDRIGRLTLDMFPEILRAVGDTNVTPPDVQNQAKFDHGRPAPSFHTPIDPAIVTYMAKRGQKRVIELRVISQLVQMMETAWMKMNLDDTFAHPVQRGWMNCFRRYTSSDVFQEYWPVLRPQYSHGFVRFCERVLAVAPLKAVAVRWDKITDKDEQNEILGLLNTEFDREWCGVLGDPNSDEKYLCWERGYINEAVKNAVRCDDNNDGKFIWIFRYADPTIPSASKIGADTSLEWGKKSDGLPHYPLGIAIVRERVDDGNEKKSSAYKELVFWVRGSHRTSDIGKEVLPMILEQIPNVNIMVRFPRVGGTAADSTQRAMWTTFFNDHDFATYALRPEIAKWEIRACRKSSN